MTQPQHEIVIQYGYTHHRDGTPLDEVLYTTETARSLPHAYTTAARGLTDLGDDEHEQVAVRIGRLDIAGGNLFSGIPLTDPIHESTGSIADAMADIRHWHLDLEQTWATDRWPPSPDGLWTADPFDATDRSGRTNPDFYLGKAAGWDEQVMRADFARLCELRQMVRQENAVDESEWLIRRADEIAARWSTRNDPVGRAFTHLERTYEAWIAQPEAMGNLLGYVESLAASGQYTGMSRVKMDNNRQVGDLTGHVAWVVDTTPDSALTTPGTPDPEVSTPTPGNPLRNSEIPEPPEFLVRYGHTHDFDGVPYESMVYNTVTAVDLDQAYAAVTHSLDDDFGDPYYGVEVRIDRIGDARFEDQVHVFRGTITDVLDEVQLWQDNHRRTIQAARGWPPDRIQLWPADPYDRNNPDDPTNPDYYARRGATTWEEQVMRADYARAEQVRRLGASAPHNNLGGSEFFERAQELVHRWRSREDAIGREWDYQDDAVFEWYGRPPGTLDPELRQLQAAADNGAETAGLHLRSQLQARELTANGTWPTLAEIQTTANDFAFAEAEPLFRSADAAQMTPQAPVPVFGTRTALRPESDTSPVSRITELGAGPDRVATAAPRSAEFGGQDPASIDYYAGKAASWAERIMRADFARAHQLRETIPFTATDRDAARLLDRAEQIAGSWRTQNTTLGRAFVEMEYLIPEWQDVPDLMNQLLTQFEPATGHEIVLPPTDMNNWRQVRELTGNGAWDSRPDAAAATVITPVHPDYYRARGASSEEAEMRADFTVAFRLEQAVPTTEFETQGDVLRAVARRRGRRWRVEQTVEPGRWQRLRTAVDGWEWLEHMRRRVLAYHPQAWSIRDDAGQAMLRDELHAGELTGNGTWHTLAETANIDVRFSLAELPPAEVEPTVFASVDAARFSPHFPVPAFGTSTEATVESSGERADPDSLHPLVNRIAGTLASIIAEDPAVQLNEADAHAIVMDALGRVLDDGTRVRTAAELTESRARYQAAFDQFAVELAEIGVIRDTWVNIRTHTWGAMDSALEQAGHNARSRREQRAIHRTGEHYAPTDPAVQDAMAGSEMEQLITHYHHMSAIAEEVRHQTDDVAVYAPLVDGAYIAFNEIMVRRDLLDDPAEFHYVQQMLRSPVDVGQQWRGATYEVLTAAHAGHERQAREIAPEFLPRHDDLFPPDAPLGVDAARFTPHVPVPTFGVRSASASASDAATDRSVVPDFDTNRSATVTPLATFDAEFGRVYPVLPSDGPAWIEPHRPPVGALQRAAALEAVAACEIGGNRAILLVGLARWEAEQIEERAKARLREFDRTSTGRSDLALVLRDAFTFSLTTTFDPELNELADAVLAELAQQYRDRFGLVVDRDGVRVADIGVDGTETQAFAEAAVAEMRRHAVVEHAVTVVEPPLRDEVASVVTAWAADGRAGRDPERNRGELIASLFFTTGIGNQELMQIEFITDYLMNIGYAPDPRFAPDQLAPAEVAKSRIDTYLSRYENGTLDDIDAAWHADLAALAPEDARRATDAARAIAAGQVDQIDALWPDHVSRADLEKILRLEFAHAWRELDVVASSVFDGGGILDEPSLRAIEQVGQVRRYLTALVDNAQGLADLERSQLRLSIAEIDIGHREVPEILFVADERSEFARSEDALANRHTERVDRSIEVITNTITADPAFDDTQFSDVRSTVFENVGYSLLDLHRIRTITELADWRVRYLRAYDQLAVWAADEGVNANTWTHVRELCENAMWGGLDRTHEYTALRREWRYRTADAIVLPPQFDAPTDTPSDRTVTVSDAAAAEIIESSMHLRERTELEQLLTRYHQMDSIARAVQNLTHDSELFVPFYNDTEPVYEEILLRRDFLDDPAEFREISRMLPTPEDVRQQWGDADYDTLTAAFAEHVQNDLHTVLPQLPTHEELFVEEPGTEQPQDPIDLIAEDFIGRSNLEADLDTAQAAIDRAGVLGEQAAAELPDWTAHLGPVPDGAVSRTEWTDLATQAAAWREQYDITDPTTLLGDRPDDDNRAQAWQDLNDHADQLRTHAIEEATRNAEHQAAEHERQQQEQRQRDLDEEHHHTMVRFEHEHPIALEP